MRARWCVPAEDGRYRYALTIPLGGSGPRLAAIMKNPSTAGAERSDATIGKTEAWAARHGFGTLVVVNLFAWRATHPATLNAHPYAAIVGPANDAVLYGAVASADVVVAAWGNPNGIAPERYDRRIREVVALLGARQLSCVGALTRLGYPRHGLLWNGDCALAPWTGPTASARARLRRSASPAWPDRAE